MEGADDLIVRVDAGGRLAYVNRASEKILGICPEECIGRMARELIHPDDFQDTVEAYSRMKMYSIDSSTHECRIIGSAGDVHNIAWTVNIHRDSKGNTTGINAIGKDATRLRQAEDALRRSVNDFRTIVSKNADGMIVLDGGGCVRYVNPAAEALFGMLAADMAGVNFGFPIVPGYPVEMYILKEFKSFVAVEMRLSEVEWEGKPSYLISFRDLTGRITAEQAIHKAREELEAEVEKRIGELSRLNASLRESEEKFRTLADTSAAAILVYQDEQYIYANPSAEQITGFSTDELLKMKFWDIMHPDDREMIRERGKARLRGEAVPSRYEVRYRTKDGWDGVIEINASTLYYNGRLAGLITALDVTERKRAEMERMNSERNLAASQEIANIGSYSWDLEKDRIAWSDQLYRILGMAPGQIRPTYDAYVGRIHPDDREEAIRKICIVINDGKPQPNEHRILRPDGTVKFVQVQSKVLKDENGKLVIINGVVQDITERKMAGEALRVSEEKYRELVESSNSIILRVDRNGSITYMNEFAQRFFGYDEGEAIGKNVVGTIVPTIDSAGRDLAAMAGDIISHPENYKNNTHQNMRKNGELVWVSWTNKAIMDGAGNLVEIHSVGNDITALKQTEEELKAANLQAELYLDLMGHDINNMHQVALGYLELAEEMGNNETMKEFLERPRDVLLRSARLIDNVRKLQKLREGVYQSRRVELAGTLSGVMREYDEVPGKSLTLDMHGNNECYVQANELLYDVFSNLVSNAIKHSGTHAEVIIDLERVQENGGAYYRIAVEDNGPGIADSFKEKVFNRLLRGDTTAKGMGLGLYIVKTLVDSYGGRVWVEDRVPGDHTKGARFMVLLPAAQRP